MEKQTQLTKDGFLMRGEAMTRIETFVAAAFAFAVTMLVISVGTMPETFDEFITATKQIPAFAASFAIIMWIWHTHAIWSRRYGLEDTSTMFLSGLLIFLVLIYIYPLRMMMQGLFFKLSGGFFPFEMVFQSAWQLRFMFAFYALGFLLLCINFMALYHHALKQHYKAPLSNSERFNTHTEILLWTAAGGVSVLAFTLSLLLPLQFIAFSGFCYFLLYPVLTAVGLKRGRMRKQQRQTSET